MVGALAEKRHHKAEHLAEKVRAKISATARTTEHHGRP